MPDVYTQGAGLARVALIAAVVALGLGMLFRLYAKRRRKAETGGAAAPEESARTEPSGQGGVLTGSAQLDEKQRAAFGFSDGGDGAGLFAVLADGADGSEAGAACARTAVQTALRAFEEQRGRSGDSETLLRTLGRAKQALETDGPRDGGTGFLASLIRQRQLWFASVGGSRICLLRSGGLIRLDRAHLYASESDIPAEEQRMEAARGCLGVNGELVLDRNVGAITLYPGDRVVLMTEGISAALPEDELTALLCDAPAAAAAAVRSRILAKSEPRPDNPVILVMEIE